jgi:hypothetical protein
VTRFAVLILISLTSSCTFFSEKVEVVVVLPEFESPLTIQSWRIIYPETCCGGIPVYSEKIISPANFEYSLTLARGVNLPVLSYPVFSLSDGNFFAGGFPAGAFFPLDVTEGGRLPLSWKSGSPSEIIRCCSLNSPVYRGFDAGRFRTVMREKAADDAGGDIWMIDPQPILCRLGYGLFRESAVCIAELMDFDIPVSVGRYVSDNPFCMFSDTDVVARLRVSVPINKKTAFISKDGCGVVTVYFDDAHWCWSDSATGASGSGRR